jgi:transcriptional regulator with XRE-family HTH domain
MTDSSPPKRRIAPAPGRRATDSPEEIAEHKMLGSRLREAREALGLLQSDTAQALGIPRSSVVAFEAGDRKVTGLELRRLARLYRRSIPWLLGEADDADVPAGSALFRAAEHLTPADKEQVLRFAQFLAAQPNKDRQADASARPRPRPRPPTDG